MKEIESALGNKTMNDASKKSLRYWRWGGSLAKKLYGGQREGRSATKEKWKIERKCVRGRKKGVIPGAVWQEENKWYERGTDEESEEKRRAGGRRGKKLEDNAEERKRREADEGRRWVIILSTSFPCGLIHRSTEAHTHTRYRQTLNLHWFDQGPVCIWVSLLFTSSVCNSRWSTMWIQCCPWVWSCHMTQPSISQTASVNLMLFYKSDKYKTWRELNSQTNHRYTLLGVTFTSMTLLVQ